jgi:hypothetical protein
MQAKPKVDRLPWKPNEEPATITACKRLRQIEADVEAIFMQLQVVRRILEPEGGPDGKAEA